MPYSHSSGSRSFGGRPQSRFNNRSGGGSRGGYNGGYNSRPRFRGPQPTLIHPSRYVNQAVEPEKEVAYEAEHTFEDFGLNPKLMENVTLRGYTTLTPIQDKTIATIMSGRDVVGLANTGTGKTAAFLLPLIHKVAADRMQGVLILAPTRELAQQIHDEFRLFSKGLHLSVALCIGGTSMDRQLRNIRENPHFVIGTPGRVKDLMNRNVFDTTMFTNVVLDEVDRMLDIGFVHDIRYLLSKLPTERYSAFFSATVNREAEDIMRTFLKNPLQVSVKTRETSANINQDVVRVTPGKNKVDVLHELLQKPEFEKVIVFGRTKHGINKLAEMLDARGVRVCVIHGNKSQSVRQKSLDQFKRGQFQALLATDVAARGIDIEDVSHVINYDEPQNYEDYIHRIGRTGRAGKIGQALTFIS